MNEQQIEKLIERLHSIKCYARSVDEFKEDIQALINWLEFGCHED